MGFKCPRARQDRKILWNSGTDSQPDVHPEETAGIRCTGLMPYPSRTAFSPLLPYRKVRREWLLNRYECGLFATQFKAVQVLIAMLCPEPSQLIFIYLTWLFVPMTFHFDSN